MQLASYLAPADRDLVLAVFARGLSVAELARAAGQRQRTITRRLRRLLLHLRRPEFAYVAAHHEAWPPLRRHTASIVLLQRRSRIHAARVLRVSIYTIRREMDAIAILIEQARAMGRLMNPLAIPRRATQVDLHASGREGSER